MAPCTIPMTTVTRKFSGNFAYDLYIDFECNRCNAKAQNISLLRKKNLISDPLPVKWSSKGKDYVCEATCKVTELIIRLPTKKV